jgi:murein L,D-transpeptidase YcbB/YkuD
VGRAPWRQERWKAPFRNNFPMRQIRQHDFVAVVRDFQRERGLSSDGIMDPNTVGALSRNAPADKKRKNVLAGAAQKLLSRRTTPRPFG